eukprot:767531-Hanusia_phi.AAC.8
MPVRRRAIRAGPNRSRLIQSLVLMVSTEPFGPRGSAGRPRLRVAQLEGVTRLLHPSRDCTVTSPVSWQTARLHRDPQQLSAA